MKLSLDAFSKEEHCKTVVTSKMTASNTLNELHVPLIGEFFS